MLKNIATEFRKHAPKVDYWSIRLVNTERQYLSVRQNTVQPVNNQRDRGAMVTIHHQGGSGYAGTADLSPEGLLAASETAAAFARASQDKHVRIPISAFQQEDVSEYHTPVAQSWPTWSLKQKLELLRHANRALQIDKRIVDWEARLANERCQTVLVNSNGAVIEQRFEKLFPHLRAVASEDGNTQTRSHGSGDLSCQGGLEQLERMALGREAPRIAKEALELLSAPDCPTDSMDLLLMPTQMLMQIHESIGHPLELDRILGDERNYAGTSFVQASMFGNYRYGSELLNVVFEPGESEELASYAYDDHGTRAEEQQLIREGVLQRALGGSLSQARAEIPGVACSRASGWNRPPIDRMANINVEPGDSSLEEMIAAVEYGVIMDTNRSWSIDDSRNKFQFGCELGHMIRDGKLAEVVKNPNYRGVSARFWRSLKMVGDISTYQILGTPICGKGEPNQIADVGHASPACLFSGVEVFSGA